MSSIFDKHDSRREFGSIKWNQVDEDVLALSNADMDFDSAPCIREALVQCAQRGWYGYTIKPDSYYESIVGWYKRKFDLDIPREWILHTPGVWPATRISFGTYAKPGDKILVQAPHFHPIISCIKDAGCIPVTNPMILSDGRYELDFEDFEKKIVEERPAVYFMVNPHNPSARVFTYEELVRLGEICVKNHVVMISDEVHSNVLYGKNVHTPAVALPPKILDNIVLITAPSKGYNVMGLTHCILLIPNEQLRKKYEESMHGYSLDFAVNTFSVTATEAAYSEAADEWLQEVNCYLQANLDFMTEYMATHIPQIKIIQPESSFVVWLDFRALGLSPAELRNMLLNKAKVALAAGEDYGPLGEGFERINIACSRKTLTSALERIAHAVSNLE